MCVTWGQWCAHAVTPAHAAPSGTAPTAAPVQAAAHSVPAPPTWSVRPFALDQVALGEGEFGDKRHLIGRFVRAVPVLADSWLSEGLFTREEREGAVRRSVRDVLTCT
ncbi:hypothetical protein CLM62_07605 [Streptomyces sp. SA15]|uniref:hypothetical protein n=1 Tax=Streptomyces sp. SA15 TaxID=934019 RepID=UPI000BAE9FD6|nr:hypothetical protein [Streptomyces sp. SA15]PAZ16431.1 hypothetical protein CLM62_07605 [Streptomyces sp. SA15]